MRGTVRTTVAIFRDFKMTYDNHKATNPDDAQLGVNPKYDDERQAEMADDYKLQVPFFCEGSDAMKNLEVMVDTAGIRNVLWALEFICNEKAKRIERNMEGQPAKDAVAYYEKCAKACLVAALACRA